MPRNGVRRRKRAKGDKHSLNRERGDALVEAIEIVGELDSHAVEELRLEIQRLARRRGLVVSELRIDTVEEGPPG